MDPELVPVSWRRICRKCVAGLVEYESSWSSMETAPVRPEMSRFEIGMARWMHMLRPMSFGVVWRRLNAPNTSPFLVVGPRPSLSMMVSLLTRSVRAPDGVLTKI